MDPAQQRTEVGSPLPPPSQTGGLGGNHPSGGGVSPSIPLQDLSRDSLISNAPRMVWQGSNVPTLGGVALLAKIGQGGMGAVYYGVHIRLEKEVAVKILPFHLAQQQPDLIQRFFREARIAARIQSPHLVTVTDVNEESGVCYLLMEFVRGQSAAAFLRDRTKAGSSVSESEALDICIAAAAGLAAAHAEGIIHRDIKPDNILLPRPKGSSTGVLLKGAKVADLGLARGEDLAQSLTGTNAGMGTPGYMSPEQCEDAKSCGKPADVFSLGATLYALLAGQAPFAGTALLKIMRATIDLPHAPIRNTRPDVSTATAALLDRCLCKRADERYADGEQLLNALQSCRQGSATVSPAGTPTVRPIVSETTAGPLPVLSHPPTQAPVTTLTPPNRISWAVAAVAVVSLIACAFLLGKVLSSNEHHANANVPASPQNVPTSPVSPVAPAPQPETKRETPKVETQPAVAKVDIPPVIDVVKPEPAKPEAPKAEPAKIDPPKVEVVKTEPKPELKPEVKLELKPEVAQTPAESPAVLELARKRAVAHQTLTTAVNAALDAKARNEWALVVEALETPLADAATQDHPNRRIADGLLNQARSEVKKESDFAAKVVEAQQLFKAGEYPRAEKAFEEARAIWPQSPKMKQVDEGLAAARTAQIPPAPKVDPNTATFGGRANAIGDRTKVDFERTIRSKLAFKFNGNTVSENDQTNVTEGRATVAVEESTEDAVHQVRVHYEKLVETVRVAGGVEQRLRQAAEGRTYVVEGDGLTVDVSTVDGEEVSYVEQSLVKPSFGWLGAPLQIIQFFKGRTVRVGEQLQPPAAFARELQIVEAATRVDRCVLKLKEIRIENGERLAIFETDIKMVQPAPYISANAQLATVVKGEAGIAIENGRLRYNRCTGTFVTSGSAQQNYVTVSLEGTGDFKISNTFMPQK